MKWLNRIYFYTLGFFSATILTFSITDGFRFMGSGTTSTGSAPVSFSLKTPDPIYKTFTITAYCPCDKCCGRYADGITASGHRIRPGDKFVAAPPEYPFGTAILIPGYSEEYVPILDRGGRIRGDKLDVFFPTHQEALNWGVQNKVVKIILERE